MLFLFHSPFHDRLRVGSGNPIHRHEILIRSNTDGFKRAEPFHQCFAACGTDTGNVFKLTVCKCFGTQFSVIGDTEAVRFITYTLYQLKFHGMVIKNNGILTVGKEDLFLFFCQTEHTHICTHIMKCLPCKAQLLRTAVDEHKIREI